MSLSDMDGFLDNILDTDQLMETGKAAAGGMVGGALYEVATRKIKFLREGTENVVMLKGLGTRVAMSVVFAALLGESQESLSKGYIGGTMSGFGVDLLRRFVPEAVKPVAGYPLARAFAAAPRVNSLAATRVATKQNIPAAFNGVRVGRPFPLAAMAGGV